MGVLDRLLGRERFSYSISDPAFAAWWRGDGDQQSEAVTPYTVLGLSAVLRSVQIIAGTIAGLPLKSYERQDDAKVRMPSDFDDPYPSIDGMTPFAWKETVITHLLLWREAYLWHEARMDGSAGTAYRPIIPDAFLTKRVNGRRVFEYKDGETGEKREVGSEQVTYIPGPSLDGTKGHPLLMAARSIFSAAISGDKAAQSTLRKGIRLGGLLVPAAPAPGQQPDVNDVDPAEAQAILEELRATMVGREHAGDIALINRRLELQKWTPSNVESQWIETKNAVLGDIERLFGVPPHLLADIEKQTSWGTGIAEQNLSLARYTLRGWTDRVQEVLSIRLPDGPTQQFCEFDYKALLQGTPEQEVRLVLDEIKEGLIDVDEGRKILNMPPRTPAQKAAAAVRQMPPQVPVSDQEVTA